jgi:signal transduction histidine kinase
MRLSFTAQTRIRIPRRLDPPINTVYRDTIYTKALVKQAMTTQFFRRHQCHEDAEAVILTVRDYGRGISDEILKKFARLFGRTSLTV